MMMMMMYVLTNSLLAVQGQHERRKQQIETLAERRETRKTISTGNLVKSNLKREKKQNRYLIVTSV